MNLPNVLPLGLLLLPGWPAEPVSESPMVDAAFYHHRQAATFLFRGDEYVRFTAENVEAGYPQKLPGNWRGLPAGFHRDLDAAVYDPRIDRIFLFQGDQVVRLKGMTVDRGYPRKISDEWKGLPASYYRGIDAATYHNGKLYLFKGGTYARLRFNAVRSRNIGIPRNYRTDRGYPAALPGSWGFSREFSENLDAALDYAKGDKNYFFKGDRYTRLTGMKKDHNHPGSRKGLARGWLQLSLASPPGSASGSISQQATLTASSRRAMPSPGASSR